MAKKRKRTHKRPQTRAARRTARAEAKQKRRLLLVGGGLAAFVLLWGVVNSLISEPDSTVAAAAVTDERRTDDPAIGPETAAVTIIEFGDFGCPSCRAWHNAGIMERIFATYPGQVRMVWRDFPIITAQSPKAAEGGQCAYDQGMFWEFHDYMYESAGSLRTNALKSYAAELGLDAAAFEQCLDSSQHRSTVEYDWQEALALRLRGTPSFFVNGQPLVGPPSFEVLQSIIEPILASSG